jgi:hypothetical protein
MVHVANGSHIDVRFATVKFVCHSLEPFFPENRINRNHGLSDFSDLSAEAFSEGGLSDLF